GIWNRQKASICHWGPPYQSESDPNTIRSGPMNFRSWPMICAHTVGNVTTDPAKVVPSSAYTFRNGADSSANCVVQLMSGTSAPWTTRDRKSTRLNSSHQIISYAVFCL